MEENEFKPISVDTSEQGRFGQFFGNEEESAPDHVPLASGNGFDIKKNDSNFVFFFGTAASGKSVILSSMLYYLNSQAGVLRPKIGTPNSKQAEVLMSDFFENIRRGVLPSRTGRDQVTRLDLVFEPNNRSKKVTPINLTFLETGGENHYEIRRGGQYHSSIDDYLNSKIPLTFIIVTSYQNAHNEDTLINDFFNLLEKKGKSLKNINVILVISQWDKSGKLYVESEDELDSFINDRLSMTSQKINNYALSRTYYTIGTVQQTHGSEERITTLNLGTAEVVSKWLYESIAGYPLDYEGTFWERVKFNFQS